MTKPLALGTLVGGVVLFIWGAIYHAALPTASLVFDRFGDEDAVASAVVAEAPRSGTYVLPWFPEGGDQAEMEAAQAKVARGPMVFASVRLGPASSMGAYLAVQFGICLLIGLLATRLLFHARAATARGRALFLMAVATAGWAAKNLSYWNWYGFGTAFTVGELLEVAIGFGLVGLAVSRLVPVPRA
jgi:hypothetical protein